MRAWHVGHDAHGGRASPPAASLEAGSGDRVAKPDGVARPGRRSGGAGVRRQMPATREGLDARPVAIAPQANPFGRGGRASGRAKIVQLAK
jgi:hypothetical protein